MTLLRNNVLNMLVFALFLTGCATQTPQFVVPDRLDFQGKHYQKVTHNQLNEMQQMLYLTENSGEDPDNWQQAILIFLDTQKQSLETRLALREKAFRHQQGTQAQIEITNQELQSQVLYPPTERFQNYQLEVTRGRNLACGFGQMQYAEKRSVLAKNWQNHTAYHALLQKLMMQFLQMPWQIGCK